VEKLFDISGPSTPSAELVERTRDRQNMSEIVYLVGRL